MPEYVYTDREGHTVMVSHAMTDIPKITCSICNATMWRKPQPFRVNWGGLPPSKGFVSESIKRQLADSREWNESHPPEG